MQTLINNASELRKNIKYLRQKYQQPIIQQSYQIIKGLIKYMKQMYAQQSQKLPQFYQGMHNVTVKIRQDLINRLRNQEIIKIDMQKGYQSTINQLQNQIEERNNYIGDLEKKIQHIGLLNDFRGEGNTEMIKIQNQNKLLHDKNKRYLNKLEKFQQAIEEKDNTIDKLKKQLNKLEKFEQAIEEKDNIIDKLKKQLIDQKQILNRSKSQQKSIAVSSSKKRQNLYKMETYRDFDEIGNITELPSYRNMTEIISNNNLSQFSDPKPKSYQFPNKWRKQNLKYKQQDLWRMILLQADAIQDVIRQESENQSYLL